MGNVKEIGIAAFYDCTNLREIELPEGIEVIRDNVFVGTSIETLVLPESLQFLGSNCMPETLTVCRIKSQSLEIENGIAFRQCKNVTVTYPKEASIQNLQECVIDGEDEGYKVILHEE